MNTGDPGKGSISGRAIEGRTKDLTSLQETGGASF